MISLKPRTDCNNPRAAITPPPGTPGAATIVTPSSKMNLIITAADGNAAPFCNQNTADAHVVNVIVLPDKWIVANNGIVKFAIFLSTPIFLVLLSVTGIVAAED